MKDQVPKGQIPIKETVKKFIHDKFLKGAGLTEIGDDDSFLENGIIDSTGVLELVGFTEETFGISIEDEEMVPDNLDSLEKISLFVNKKLTGL